MSTFYFAGIPFELPAGVQITETAISDNFKSYYSVNPGGERVSFNLTKIGDQFWTYSGDINLSITRIGDSFTSFSGDINGSINKIGGMYFGLEEERRDFFSEILSSSSGVSTLINADIDGGTNYVNGTSGDDDITFDSVGADGGRRVEISGGEGDDVVTTYIIKSDDFIQVNGDEGDDVYYASFWESNSNSYDRAASATALFLGAQGTDIAVLFVNQIQEFTVSQPSSGLREINLKDGNKFVLGADCEVFTMYESMDERKDYLVEDLFAGRIRSVAFEERFYRTTGKNADWYLNQLDTYAEFHSEASMPEGIEPEVTQPAPYPKLEPESKDYDGIIESIRGKGKLKGTDVADAFTFDSFDVFTKKSADKIIGFDASQGDSIAVSSYAFPALQGASGINFASTKNRKELKLLSKQDYDFVYFEKKARLYFDGNGTDKNWGGSNEGGLVAILIGKPELTGDDFKWLA